MNKDFLEKLCTLADKNNSIDGDLYNLYDVKRGLRHQNGTGVLVGLTEIGDVHGYIIDEEERVPSDGRLLYRGINTMDLANNAMDENRFGFEETVYLLLFGQLPTAAELNQFKQAIGTYRELPEGFVENMILKAPSSDIMNKLARSVLVSYSYDNNPDDVSLENLIKQSIRLIAQFPTLAAYAYQAKAHHFDKKPLIIRRPDPNLTHAENLLYMMRPDGKYTKTEAKMLDLMWTIHAEHGGGNNSSFTVHVVSSSGTDIYSSIAAAIGSLKGPRHGGASGRVTGMMSECKKMVADWTDDKQVEEFLTKVMNKEVYDKSGLIYGIGHAVYTLSDPRAVLIKQRAGDLAAEKGMEAEFQLFLKVEELSPKVFKKVKGLDKAMSANVDFYSGLVYSMLGIPQELHTPMFAVARVAGWCAHILEEAVAGGRIVRPAFKYVGGRREYRPLEDRD